MREYRPFRVNVRESMSQEGGLEGGLIQQTISIPVLKPTLLLVFFNQFILREERRAAVGGADRVDQKRSGFLG